MTHHFVTRGNDDDLFVSIDTKGNRGILSDVTIRRVWGYHKGRWHHSPKYVPPLMNG